MRWDRLGVLLAILAVLAAPTFAAWNLAGRTTESSGDQAIATIGLTAGIILVVAIAATLIALLVFWLTDME